jgi:hypothetical protein
VRSGALTLREVFLIVPHGSIPSLALTVMTAINMQQEQVFTLSGAPGIASGSQQVEPSFDPDALQCCGTGCTVCVLDYPELFSLNQTDSGQTDCNMLALLEAVEQAQAQADKMIADGE